MDFFDFRILSILNQNSRANYGDIARVLRLSPTIVTDRIQTMLDSRIINRFVVTIDDRYFNRVPRLLRFRTDENRAIAMELLQTIEEFRIIYPMLPSTFFCWLTVEDEERLKAIIDQLSNNLDIQNVHYWTPIRPLPRLIELDAVDYSVLRVLRNDPRISIQRLAKAVDKPYTTIRSRFQRLVDAEVCRFRLEFYPSRIERVIAFVLFTVVEQARHLVPTLNQCFTLFPNRWDFSTLNNPPSVYYGTYAGKIADIDEMLQMMNAQEYTKNVAFYLYLEHLLCDSIYDRLLDDMIVHSSDNDSR